MSCNRGDLVCKPFAPLTLGPAPNVWGQLGIEGKKVCDQYFNDQSKQYRKLMHGYPSG